MTRDILSSALDLIDESYVASVTDKKLKSTPKTTVYAVRAAEPSVWRKLLDVAAVLILVVGVTVGFTLMRRSIGPGNTPADSLTDTTNTDTEETTDTEPIDTEDTEPPETEAAEKYKTYTEGDKVYALYDDHAELIKADSVMGKIVSTEVRGLPVTAVADSVTFADYEKYGALFGYRDSVLYDYAVEHGLDFVEILDCNAPDNYIADPTEPDLIENIDEEGIENNVKISSAAFESEWRGYIEVIDSDVSKYLRADETERRELKEKILEQVVDHMLRSRYLLNAVTGGLPSYYVTADDPSAEYFSNKYRVATIDSQGNISYVYDLSCYADIGTFPIFSRCICNTFCFEYWSELGEYYLNIGDKIYSRHDGEPVATYNLDDAVYDIEIHLNRIVLTAKSGKETHKFVLERNKHSGNGYNNSYWRWSEFDGLTPFSTSTVVTHDKVTLDGIIYTLTADNEYVVTGVSDKTVTKALIPAAIDDIPVTGIEKNSFDSVDDPLNFRIFGYKNSFAHDYAVEYGHIFIEYFDGSFPDHYYPEGVTLNEWTKSEPNEVFIAVDDTAEIDALVAGYLDGEDTYDELLARLIYRLRCAYDLEKAWILLQPYYTSDLHHSGDYDRYRVYSPSFSSSGGFHTDEYIWQRFGTIEYCDDFLKNIDIIMGKNAKRLTYVYYDEILNIDGWLFIPWMGSGTAEAKNLTYEMTVEEGKIALSCNYDMYAGNHTSVTLLVRGEDGWYFEDCGCLTASENLEYLFEDYLDEILG